MGVKPIPTHISRYATKDEVIYRCSKCGESFRFYGYKETTCRQCGEEINWGVVVRVNESIKNAYHNGISGNIPLIKIQKAIVDFINDLNEINASYNACRLMMWPNDIKNEFEENIINRAENAQIVFFRT